MKKQAIVEKKDTFRSLSEIENIDQYNDITMSDDEMVKVSNEGSVLGQGGFPFLSLNGKSGKFFLNKKEITGKIGIIVLRVRQSLTAMSEMQASQKWAMWSEEVDNKWDEQVRLFRKEDGKIKEVGEGNFATLKAMHTEEFKNKETGKMENKSILKEQTIFYALLLSNVVVPQIVKVGIKGMSVSELIQFYKEFAAGEHLFDWILGIGSKTVQNAQGVDVITYDFTKECLTTAAQKEYIKKAMLMVENSIQSYKEQKAKNTEVLPPQVEHGNFDDYIEQEFPPVEQEYPKNPNQVQAQLNEKMKSAGWVK